VEIPRKAKHFLLITIVTICFFIPALSQEYFQQEVNYEIKVALNDKKHELNASETITYINNSPDTLRFLYFHLWPNAYASNQSELAKQLFSWNGKEKLFADPELKGFIDSLDFKVNNESIRWNLLPGHSDICQLWLNSSIQHDDTIKITTPFHVKIPKGVVSRMGHLGQSYQISQWYPKPAVYDRNGWHPMSYLDQGEFYSEFGSFDVSITLPANYIVAATGELQNAPELRWLDKLAAIPIWRGAPPYDNEDFPPSSDLMKTLHYKGQQMHDFAWFADKRFHVKKGSVKLPESGKEVTIWAMFTDKQTAYWQFAVPFIEDVILHYSNQIGNFPYPCYTAVESSITAGDGMEYPGLAVIGSAESAYSFYDVLTHEIAHNWFYAALGTDERRYPYMDEGITSAYELMYMNEKFPGKKLWEIYFKSKKLASLLHMNMSVERMQEIQWLIQARNNLEQRVNLPSQEFTALNYNLIIYYKAAVGFIYLKAYLGDTVFNRIMQKYYHTWRFKHPQPEDLRRVFELETGKDLSWFFIDFLDSTKRLDYAILNFKNGQLLVKNREGLAGPLIVCGMVDDSIVFKKWIEGFDGEKWITIPPGNYSEIKIDPEHVMPEFSRLNNNIRSSGIFRKADPIRLQYLLTLEEPDNRYIMYLPSVNWTKENGFMAGLALHNGFFMPKPLSYFVIPFYSFKTTDLAGFGKVSFNIIPQQFMVRKATLSLEGTKFGAPGNQNFYKVKTGFELNFRNKQMNNPFNQKVFGYYYAASDLSDIESYKKAKINSYLQFGYTLENTSLINPFNVTASMEWNHSYQKTWMDFNYRLSYNGKNKGLDVRIFAGLVLKDVSRVPFYAFSPSGRTGREQYLYQGFYPDRFATFPKTFWSKQTMLSEGGLVSYVNDSLGYSQHIVSLSITSSLPQKAGWIPVRPFANVVWNGKAGNSNRSPFLWEIGLKSGIWNFFEIYVPLFVSGNIREVNSSFRDRVRFVFTLDFLNQIKLNASIL
jgi:hypothetical protein